MIEPLRSGRYVGEADLALTPDRPRECFSASAWRRLARQQLDGKPEPGKVRSPFAQEA
jgi:hypothetical protein